MVYADCQRLQGRLIAVCPLRSALCGLPCPIHGGNGALPVYSRPFAGDSDASLLVDVVTAASAVATRCSYWHVGDVWWGLYQDTDDRLLLK